MANALEQINNEYWIACIPDDDEAWSNFHHSGYPVLAPNQYPSSEIPGESLFVAIFILIKSI